MKPVFDTSAAGTTASDANSDAAIQAAIEQQIAEIYAASYAEPSTDDTAQSIHSPLDGDTANSGGARPEDDLLPQHDAPDMRLGLF